MKDAAQTCVWNVELNEEIMAKTSAFQILDVVQKHFERFNIVNFVTALQRIAKSPDGHHAVEGPGFTSLARTVRLLCCNGSAHCDPYSLVSSLWASRKACHRGVEITGAASEEVLSQAHKYGDFKLPELSQTAWSLATLKLKHVPLFQAISAQSIRRINESEPQDISITAWAFAKLGVLDPPLMAALASEAIKKMQEFKGQNLSNLAWA